MIVPLDPSQQRLSATSHVTGSGCVNSISFYRLSGCRMSCKVHSTQVWTNEAKGKEQKATSDTDKHANTPMWTKIVVSLYFLWFSF